jgi:hypothetical protein
MEGNQFVADVCLPTDLSFARPKAKNQQILAPATR